MLPLCDSVGRCSCSPVNRAASISVLPCLHVKNAQLCIWCAWMWCAPYRTPFWAQQGSFCLPFHSSGPYVSLLFPPPTAPWTPRGQRAARLSGCRTLWDGTDDNLCAPQGWSRDGKMDRAAEWRDREEEKDKITEVRGVCGWCDFTPQANTYVRKERRGQSYCKPVLYIYIWNIYTVSDIVHLNSNST